MHQIETAKKLLAQAEEHIEAGLPKVAVPTLEAAAAALRAAASELRPKRGSKAK